MFEIKCRKVLTPLKARLKSFHEVVVRNRLEQLRKRQRDEALQAQEELLAGVATAASKKPIGPVVPADGKEIDESAEEVEPYDRAMSPKLIDITKLRGEEREADIISAAEDRRNIVSQLSLGQAEGVPIFFIDTATPYRRRYPLCSKSYSAIY